MMIVRSWYQRTQCEIDGVWKVVDTKTKGVTSILDFGCFCRPFCKWHQTTNTHIYSNTQEYYFIFRSDQDQVIWTGGWTWQPHNWSTPTKWMTIQIGLLVVLPTEVKYIYFRSTCQKRLVKRNQIYQPLLGKTNIIRTSTGDFPIRFSLALAGWLQPLWFIVPIFINPA